MPAVVGGTIGGVVVVVVIAVGMAVWWRVKRKRRLSRDFAQSLGKGNFF